MNVHKMIKEEFNKVNEKLKKKLGELNKAPKKHKRDKNNNKKQIKSLKETVESQKDNIESAKMITEMFDIPKIKQIYDEKMKYVEEKSEEKIKKITFNSLESIKKMNKKWSDSTLEYIRLIAGALLYIKPKTREILISRNEYKHINGVC